MWMSRHFFRNLVSIGSLLFLFSFSELAQQPGPVLPVEQNPLPSSSQTYPQPKSLWLKLHQEVPSLLESYKQYQSNLEQQIQSLRVKNQLSMDYIVALEQDNSLLITSMTSLQLQVQTSQNNLRHLQLDLKNSTKYITDAQAQVILLQARMGALKITCYISVGIIAVAGGYEGGHLLKWW